MEEWWKRNSEVTLEDYTKVQVEDITGCIPLLLDTCVVDGKFDLNVTDFRAIYDKAATFEQTIRNETRKNPQGWKLYVELVRPLGHS